MTTTLTDPVLEWDFAPFTEQVSLQAPDEVPAVDYSGITILGAQATDGKDYISTDGARFNGAGTPGVRRSIVYTPAADGVITVTFRSNNSNYRRLHIADSELNELIQADAANAEVDASATLHAGTTYYMWIDNGGGGTFTKIRYEL